MYSWNYQNFQEENTGEKVPKVKKKWNYQNFQQEKIGEKVPKVKKSA